MEVIPPGQIVGKRIMMWTRRAHLYLGLFLFPWAVLYGVTAFLFNHPTMFSDAPTVDFNKSTSTSTALADLPSLKQQAEDVLKALNCLLYTSPSPRDS